mgnify:FL=1
MNHNLILEVVEQIVLLQEGGNAKAIDIETGDVKQFKGRPANAEQIPLRKINIPKFTAAFRKLFFRIDDMFSMRFDRGLWPERKAFEDGINSGAWFSGSSSVMFDPRVEGKDISDVKEEAGDIDVQMPLTNIPDLFAFLHEIEGQEIMPGVTYIGNNDKSAKAADDQIHGIFAYDAGLENPIFVQIDFEGVDFEDDQPEEFVQFGRSSSFSDMKRGLKGVGHKYLLMNLARASSQKPGMKIAKGSATIEKLSQNLEKQLSRSKKHQSPSTLAFSVRKGMRDKFEKFATIGEEEIYKELASSNSTYTTSVAAIFERFFGKQPSEQEFDKFWSYTGVLELIHDILGPQVLKDTMKLMIDKSLYGPFESQMLYRNDRKRDEKTKMRMIDIASQMFPVVNEILADLDEKKEAYYDRKIEKTKEAEAVPEFEPVAESAQLLRKLIREVIAKR